MYPADYWIDKLNLNPHPEGGFYAETYRSERTMEVPGLGSRNYSTGIYFLMQEGNFSAFHRIKSDEMWHFYSGDALEIFYFDENGRLRNIRLGTDPEKGEVFQAVVPAGVWFASRPVKGGEYALVGCTVAPGFDFRDFEMAERENLRAQFPDHHSIIEQLTRD